MTWQFIPLVEDDRDIRRILAETLEDYGFSVVTAVNGLEALRTLRGSSKPPSLILLDLLMPVLDGYGFLDERKKDAALAGERVAVTRRSCLLRAHDDHCRRSFLMA